MRRRPGDRNARLEISGRRKKERRANRAIPATGFNVERQVAPMYFVKDVEELIAQSDVRREVRLNSPLILNVSEIQDFAISDHGRAADHVHFVQTVRSEGVGARIVEIE